MSVHTPGECGTVRVLLMSRDGVYSRFLAERLSREGMSVHLSAAVGAGAAAALDAAQIDVVIVETHGLGETDWALVELVRERAPLIEIIAISAGPLVDAAVEALRSGVFSILAYPVTDDQLVRDVSRACARKRRGEARLMATEGRSS
jgi:DNA-binding NtrC family response regulator